MRSRPFQLRHLDHRGTAPHRSAEGFLMSEKLEVFGYSRNTYDKESLGYTPWVFLIPDNACWTRGCHGGKARCERESYEMIQSGSQPAFLGRNLAEFQTYIFLSVFHRLRAKIQIKIDAVLYNRFQNNYFLCINYVTQLFLSPSPSSTDDRS